MTSWPKRKWCWAGCRVVGREDGVNLAGWEVNGIGGFCVGFFFSNTFFLSGGTSIWCSQQTPEVINNLHLLQRFAQ